MHFPGSAKKFPIRGRGFYKMTGKIIEEFDVYTLDVHHMEKLPMVNKKMDEAMIEASIGKDTPAEFVQQ